MPNAESNIAKFFASAPLPAANAVFGIVRSMLKERNSLANAPATTNARGAVKQRRKRGPNKPKPTAASDAGPENAAKLTQGPDAGEPAADTPLPGQSFAANAAASHLAHGTSASFSTQEAGPIMVDAATGQKFVL